MTGDYIIWDNDSYRLRRTPRTEKRVSKFTVTSTSRVAFVTAYQGRSSRGSGTGSIVDRQLVRCPVAKASRSTTTTATIAMKHTQLGARCHNYRGWIENQSLGQGTLLAATDRASVAAAKMRIQICIRSRMVAPRWVILNITLQNGTNVWKRRTRVRRWAKLDDGDVWSEGSSYVPTFCASKSR